LIRWKTLVNKIEYRKAIPIVRRLIHWRIERALLNLLVLNLRRKIVGEKLVGGKPRLVGCKGISCFCRCRCRAAAPPRHESADQSTQGQVINAREK
jgi:hypothetical protein